MPFIGVLTNKELYENAPDTVEEVIKNWQRNHVNVLKYIGDPIRLGKPNLIDWAASNLRYDPEFLGAMKKEFGIE